MITKPFNLAHVKPDLSNLRTRGEHKVLEIHCFERAATPYPVVYVDEKSSLHYVTLRGEAGSSNHTSSKWDLVLVEEPKLIDFSKIPVDTLVQNYSGVKRRFCRATDDEAFTFFNGADSLTNKPSGAKANHHLKLIENPTFTFWQGGNCPVPEGVEVEVILRNGVENNTHPQGIDYVWKHQYLLETDIIAYRILGAAEGYSPFFQGREF